MTNTLSVRAFTLIKLVFETQAAKLCRIMRRNGSREKRSRGLFKTWLQFFHCIF